MPDHTDVYYTPTCTRFQDVAMKNECIITIEKTLASSTKENSHESILSVAREKFSLVIRSDEDDEAFQEGFRTAKNVMEMCKGYEIQFFKSEYLPLQGSSLWGRWSELEKQRRRKKDEYLTNLDDTSQMQMEMSDIRARQARKGVTPFMKKVIDQMFFLKEKQESTFVE